MVKLLQSDLNIARGDDELYKDIDDIIAFETVLANVREWTDLLNLRFRLP